MNRRPNRRAAGEDYPSKAVLHEHVRQMLMLERLCSRFHDVVLQLRSRQGQRETFPLEDDHDLQYLLHALLILDHEDIRPQAWTPPYSGGSPRTDLLLRLEKIIVAARMARAGFEVKDFIEQLPADIQHYMLHPDCRTLVCFVYDPEGRFEKARELENELSGDRDGLKVRVIIAPKNPQNANA